MTVDYIVSYLIDLRFSNWMGSKPYLHHRSLSHLFLQGESERSVLILTDCINTIEGHHLAVGFVQKVLKIQTSKYSEDKRFEKK